MYFLLFDQILNACETVFLWIEDLLLNWPNEAMGTQNQRVYNYWLRVLISGYRYVTKTTISLQY